jgi:hypothetical protein
VALIRTDVSEDRIASIFMVHECEQRGFHGGDYDDYHLLGDDTVWLL